MSDPRHSSPPTMLDLLLAAALSGLVLGLAHFWGLSSPWIVNDDVRQQVFWMQRWWDLELYPGDPLCAYAEQLVPLGVRSVYRLAAFFLNPVYFSKALPLLLFALLGAGLFSSAQRLGNRSGAWCAVASLWLTTLFSESMAGGLSRSFAAPTLILFLDCWLAGRGWGMAMALLAQALFIPYVLPVCAGAALLDWAFGRVAKQAKPPLFLGQGWHWLVLGLALGLVWWHQHGLNQAGYGPLPSLEQIAGRPEFGPQGRYQILPQPSLAWELLRPWGAIAPFREAGPWLGVAVAVLLAAGGLAGWHRLGWRSLRAWRPLGLLLVSALGCYTLARFFLLRLSIPDRYLIYVLAVAYCLLLARGWAAWLDFFAPRKAVAILLLVVAALVGAARSHGLELYDYSPYRPLYEALDRTPKDGLVAGHPFLMDNVLTFAQRPVLASFELAHCWHLDWWRFLEPRLRDMLEAYYASDPEALRQLARRWGVSYLVADRRHFTAEFLTEWPMFAPYDQLIRATAASGAFAALQPGLFPTTEVDDNIVIIDLRAWRAPLHWFQTSPDEGDSLGHMGLPPSGAQTGWLLVKALGGSHAP